MKKLIGIDDISVYVPKTHLELVPEESVKTGNYVDSEFSKSRGFPPSYIAKGIGVYQFGWPDGHEDPNTMAAMACIKLIKGNDIELSKIGRLLVGTETSVDHSKPNAVYISGIIERVLGEEGDMKNCTCSDIKFACAATTTCIEFLSEWIESGKNKEKYGIAIGTDISSYPLKTKEEVTQGAGAVAMLIKENPRLLALENNIASEFTSTITRDEKDFFRPVDKHTAVVNGQLSIDTYLDCSKAAFIDFREKAKAQGFIKDGEILTDKVDRIIVHLPFPKMGEYAGAALFRHEWRNTPRFKEIEKEIGPEPQRENFGSEEKYKEAYKIFDKNFRETKLFRETFSKKMEKGSVAARRTGNIYTGAIYAAFDSMLEQESKEGTDLAGMRFAFGSYASGSMFKALTGIIQPDYKEVVKELDLFKMLDERRIDKKSSLSLQDYERLHENLLGINESVIPPKNEVVLARIGTSSLDEGYRYYDFVD